MNLFLSLSFVDATFVREVYRRLPRGVARFYERGFERGEDLVTAMEAGLDASDVFVLFASKVSLESYAVQFEISEARYRQIEGKLKKILVFPVEAGLSFSSLPRWLQRSWVPNAGETPADVARYLTTLLLEPDRGLSIAAPKVVGRGVMLDHTERVAAAHLQKRKQSPRAYIFSGLTGVGRKTFAAYYLRRALSAEANLPFGPVISLSAQAELIDIYRALRTEVNPFISVDEIAADQRVFVSLDVSDQISEIVRVSAHFARLGQAITIMSAAGFFEDAGRPKEWVKPFIQAIPQDQILVMVTNLQFSDDYVDSLNTAIQMRVRELEDDDVRALMIFTAKLFGLENFSISDRLLTAIGGHADVANAAVKLALQKGNAILERDPRQLFNIQQSIIGDVVNRDNLTETERTILDVLGWLPGLGSDLLEKIIVEELKTDIDKFNGAIENLILSCLIYANKYRFSIAPSVRQYYRRFNVTEATTLSAMAKVFSQEWKNASGFREDLFAAFIFMQVLEGKSLPRELQSLLTPGNLHDAVRDAYARGKETDDNKAIQQAINWGKVAFEMIMTEGVREEILSTVARAQIRLEAYPDAIETIEFMRKKGYRSVTFLEGHLLRKKRNFEEAIPKLRHVVENFRHNRAAVHELALCYRRLRRSRELESLLKAHGEAVGDSPIFLDFMIGLSISRGDLERLPEAIQRLRAIGDNSGRADLRYAQYLMRQGNHKGAVGYLNQVLNGGGPGARRLRAIRAIAAAKVGDFKLARNDLAFIRSLPNYEAKSANIEIQILYAEGRLTDAFKLSDSNPPQEPGDWLVRAGILDALANAPETSITNSAAMRKEAADIRAKYTTDLDYVFDDE